MGSIPQIQWNMDEKTKGMPKSQIWRFVVRSRTEKELNKLLYFIKKAKSCMIVVRDMEDLWTLFLCKSDDKSDRVEVKVKEVVTERDKENICV